MVVREVFGKVKKVVLAVMMGVLMVGTPVLGVRAVPVYAAEGVEVAASKKPETNIIFKDDKSKRNVKELLRLAVDILLYGLGAAATLGVVVAGIMYLTARDNPQMVAKAKTRLIEVAIGLVAWAMLFAVLKFLIPGFTGV